jgi:hypothetical protein
MNGLQARLLSRGPSPDGTQADLLLIEPNGDEHLVRCLCKDDGSTEIGGDGEMVGYLNDKYGSPNVCSLSRQTTLG